jgi:hypothetical protein
MEPLQDAQTPYSPLLDSSEIRLLEPQRGSTEDSISCTLSHCRVSSEERGFEAISYMWGPEVTKSIQINGMHCLIRENLWEALQHLRLQDRTRRLWVDALCINQVDMNERNQQVSQIGSIYSIATRVLVWLGMPDSTSLLAIQTLQQIHEGTLSYNWMGWRSNSLKDGDKFQALFLLFSREYWSRL